MHGSSRDAVGALPLRHKRLPGLVAQTELSADILARNVSLSLSLKHSLSVVGSVSVSLSVVGSARQLRLP